MYNRTDAQKVNDEITYVTAKVSNVESEMVGLQKE
jgi:hypothetical protein